jgi:hypothetical protein
MKFIFLFLFSITVFAQNPMDTKGKIDSTNNRWSFGVLYVPYYSGKIYSIEQSSYSSSGYSVYTTSDNETNMEAQLSFAANEKIHVTFDVGYTSTYYENRSETHTRSDNYRSDSGTLDKNDLTLLNFNLGIKYYFKGLAAKKVSIYAIAGIGKQFAFAEQKNENLYQEQQPGSISENNQDEFTKDSNSPFHLNFGFGAEYFFNESLSLNSNIRFIYSRVEAKYDSRVITSQGGTTSTTSTSSTINYNKSDFITRIGLGVNFYF